MKTIIGMINRLYGHPEKLVQLLCPTLFIWGGTKMLNVVCFFFMSLKTKIGIINRLYGHLEKLVQFLCSTLFIWG